MTAQIPLVGGNYYHIYNRGNSRKVGNLRQVANFRRASMAFSIRYERTDSLFQKPFKHRLVDSDRYFATLVRYVHRNPEKHGLIPDFREWP